MPRPPISAVTETYGGKRMSPEAVERQRVATRVKTRAVRRLIESHRHEYEALLAEEWAKEGPPPSMRASA